MKQIDKIVIVGGGSSGWMTAASLIKNFPEKDITLIESSDIPTVGVGESTIGSINTYLRDLGLKDEDWMAYCNATYKLSIDFTNWDGKGTRGKYPFGSSTWKGKFSVQNWFIKQALVGAEKTEYAKFALGSVQMIDANKLTKNTDRKIQGFNFDTDTAYHMDAGLFGDYLKKEYCKPRGVKHIVDDVNEIDQDTDGNIISLKTLKGETLTADLFIDCTGFKSLLLTETLNEPFIPFTDKLMNDKAVALRIPYVDREKEMEHSTNATTLSSGWVWNIPLWDRIGTGYVYSSRFISDEDAAKEFKEYLINDRDIPHPREEIESLEPFFVDITPGIHERAWVKNVCAIGLSNGFIEPLESTGLMLTHNTIFALVETLQSRANGKVNGMDIQTFNMKVRHGMEKFSGFIASHFAYAERDDTPYWKYVTEELQYTESDQLEWQFFNYTTKDMAVESQFGWITDTNGVPFIMACMGYNPISKMQVEKFHGANKDGFEGEYRIIEDMNDTMASYEKDVIPVIDKLHTHLQFLKDTIYKNYDK
jgi:hypothetical protein